MRSIELVQAILFILFSYHFLCILLNLSAFPTSFLPIGGSTLSCNFLFSFLYIILTWCTTNFISYFSLLPFLNPFSYSYYSGILQDTTTSTTLEYYHIDHFGVLLHQSLWDTTHCLFTLGYYYIDYFGYYHIVYFLLAWRWVLPLTQYFTSKHIRSRLYKIFILNFASFSVILYQFLVYTVMLAQKKPRPSPLVYSELLELIFSNLKIEDILYSCFTVNRQQNSEAF